jgi:uncharacterized protein YdeI (YjbR/CyaY-like superfamily)
VQALRQEIQTLGSGLNARLDRLVTSEVYALQSAHTDQRITSLSQDLQKEVSAREAVETAFEKYQLDERDRRERDRQTRLYSAIIPVLMCLVSAAIGLWAVVK